MSVRAARRAALIRLGGVESVKEQCRDQRGLPVLDHLLQDVRYALRSLARQPGFTAVALATLALGIGANSAIFSVVNAVLLRPLPYDDPGRLVRVVDLGYKGEFLALKERSRTLDVAAHGFNFPVTLTGGSEPLRVQSTPVSANLFDLLGRGGRTGPYVRSCRRASRGWPRGHPHPCALAARFDANPTIIGQPINLDGIAHSVVGVMPPNFLFPWAATDLCSVSRYSRVEHSRTSTVTRPSPWSCSVRPSLGHTGETVIPSDNGSGFRARLHGARWSVWWPM